MSLGRSTDRPPGCSLWSTGRPGSKGTRCIGLHRDMSYHLMPVPSNAGCPDSSHILHSSVWTLRNSRSQFKVIFPLILLPPHDLTILELESNLFDWLRWPLDLKQERTQAPKAPRQSLKHTCRCFRPDEMMKLEYSKVGDSWCTFASGILLRHCKERDLSFGTSLPSWWWLWIGELPSLIKLW